MILIDEKKCTGCGICVRDCPVNAMGLKKKKAYVDSLRCTQCGLCVRICDYGAVSVDEALVDGSVKCGACPINCKITPGYYGACQRYKNAEGKLIRATKLHTYDDLRDIIGPQLPLSIKQPLVSGIGAGTTYPDCRPSPVIVYGKRHDTDVVTVATEAPLSYSSLMIKIDTDTPIGEEGADVLVGKRKVGIVITEQYGAKMLSIGGVNLLTGPNGITVAKTMVDMANRRPVKLKIEGGAKLELQVGYPPLINGERPVKMRVGCGSATMGLFAPFFKEAADEVIVLDSHLTSLMSEHAAGRYVGARPTGIKLRFKMSTPGRYFGDHGYGWGGTSITNPLDVIQAIDMSIAWPGMRILITETTGTHSALFELQEDGSIKQLPLTGEAERVVRSIWDTCEQTRVSAIYMGGTGGSARAGVVRYPQKLTEAVHDARAALTVGGAPVFLLPGGGINFMVDVERVKRGAFYWTPTPATICPVEYTMELQEYERIGGHVEVMKPFNVEEPARILD